MNWKILLLSISCFPVGRWWCHHLHRGSSLRSYDNPISKSLFSFSGTVSGVSFIKRNLLMKWPSFSMSVDDMWISVVINVASQLIQQIGNGNPLATKATPFQFIRNRLQSQRHLIWNQWLIECLLHALSFSGCYFFHSFISIFFRFNTGRYNT